MQNTDDKICLVDGVVGFYFLNLQKVHCFCQVKLYRTSSFLKAAFILFYYHAALTLPGLTKRLTI